MLGIFFTIDDSRKFETMRRNKLLIACIFSSLQMNAQVDLVKLQQDYMSRKPALDSMYAYPDVPFDSLRTTSEDGISISFWWMPREKKKGTVLLVHGFGMNKSHMLPRARIYYKLGYNVILMDLRARGQSGGKLATPGPETGNDVAAVIQYYNSGLKDYGPLILAGYSHGGRAVVFAAKKSLPMITAIILESIPYSLTESFRRTYKTNPPPIPEGNIDAAFEAIAEKPVLLMTGDTDEAIIPDEARKIKGFLRNENSQLVIFENAGHDLSKEKNRTLYEQSIQLFLAHVLRLL